LQGPIQCPICRFYDDWMPRSLPLKASGLGVPKRPTKRRTRASRHVVMIQARARRA
jgi:hypothetical protein